MKVLYLAKHDSGGNDDEGAVYHALLALGCDVERLRENRAQVARKVRGCDFLLCHHPHDLDALRAVQIPKVFWCFDLIDWPNMPRHAQRASWARQLTDVCDLGFLTDGDWVARDTTGKLRWLPQGADTRVPQGECPSQPPCDVLVVGGLGYGREGQIEELRSAFGDGFRHVAKGYHGLALRALVRSAKVVVAPFAPVTDRYWSNRVYLLTGMGALVLHPHCAALDMQYAGALPMYRGRGDALAKALYWVNEASAEGRARAAQNCQRLTLTRHTYTDRVRELLVAVKEKLL